MSPSSITRRTAMKAAAAAIAAPFFNRNRYALFAQSSQEYSERAVRLVRESLVIDMLNQFLYRRDMQPKLRAMAEPSRARSRAPISSDSSTPESTPPASAKAPTTTRTGSTCSPTGTASSPPIRIGCCASARPPISSAPKPRGRYGILFGMQNSAHFRSPDDVDTFYGLGPAVRPAHLQLPNADRQRRLRAA